MQFVMAWGRGLLALAMLLAAGVAWAGRPNLLLVVADDLNADSVGAFGAQLAGTTPNIDRIANRGMRFAYAHVQVANCQPSRNVMWSGRYPHSNGIDGFYSLPRVDYQGFGELLNLAGYHTAILNKVRHSTAYPRYPWAMVLDEHPAVSAVERYNRHPATYGRATTLAIETAREADKPFAVLLNLSDPHVPFYGYDKHGRPRADPYSPSRVFGANEISVPGFLPDDPLVREEVARYYSSVRRADDAVGEILAALKSSGEEGNTLVLFLSDHGMAFPFAKTQLYHHSTRTPLIVRWPGVTRPGSVDDAHMVSAVDILPTLLEVVGEPAPAGIQGRSFAGLLRGVDQDERDSVYKVYNENSSGMRRPMRAVQTRRYLYIFNPWSDGRRRLRSATMGTKTFRRMQELATTNEAVAQRLRLLQYREREEFYDLQDDPDCLHNLIAEPDLVPQLDTHRALLAHWMRRTDDPMYDTWLQRDDEAVISAYMHEQRAIEQKRRSWRKAIRETLQAQTQETVETSNEGQEEGGRADAIAH